MQNYYELPQCSVQMDPKHTWQMLEMIDWLEYHNISYLCSFGEAAIREYKYQRVHGEMSRINMDHKPYFRFWQADAAKDFKLAFVRYLVIPRRNDEDQEA